MQTLFRYWDDFMYNEVVFWKISGDLDIHTQGHCERVLMHALRIGEARHATDRQMLALAHAAIFHDTRRKDNYLDTGHGARAAEYYRAFFSFAATKHTTSSTHATISPSFGGNGGRLFLPEAYAAVWYHDRDDGMGDEYIREHTANADECRKWLEVYHIFKDSDGLDRLRLGEWCLDPKFLRTPEAKGMMPFAQQLVELTTPHDELMRTYKSTEPFRPKPGH